jgi:hypothetical protein
MNIFTSIWNGIKAVEQAVILTIGKIHWTTKDTMTADEQDKIRKLLEGGYYIILTRRKNHLSTFFVNLATWFLTFKWGYWSHSLMNLEDTVVGDDDFRLVEAIGTGVQYTPFADEFDCTSVALLSPKGLTTRDWTLMMEKANSELGKPYDTLFDLKNDNALSCVELVRDALMSVPDYATRFAAFEAMIAKDGNLDPQTFYNCPDFEIVYEARH